MAMNVLDRPLVEPFPRFWRTFSHDLDVTSEEIERGLISVFGDQGVDSMETVTPRWMSLPDDDLAYHTAHELTHRLMGIWGYPRTVRGPGYPVDSAEARVGADLEEMVLHPALESILDPFGFKRDFILRNMAGGALRGLTTVPVPEYGTPWHFTWAIRYCGLRLDLPDSLWHPITLIYHERAPEISKLGEELLDIMNEAGWLTREQVLDAMLMVRNSLGLDVQGKVLVLDPTTGRVV